MKRVWPAVLFIGALLLQSAEGARHGLSFARSWALPIVGALGGFFIEERPPHSSPDPPNPNTPLPPRSSPLTRLPPQIPVPSPPPPPSANCSQLVTLTQGPYWIDENIEAANVRTNLSYGVPLNITMRIINGTLSALQGTCVPIEQARVDLWQCRYDGVYSDEAKDKTSGETWLRGYQYTNSSGHVSFYTIFPGWYKSRTVHIHVRVRIYEADGITTSYNKTTQMFFDDTVSTAIFSDVYPYNIRGLRDTFNTDDSLFRSGNVLTLTGSYNDTGGFSSQVELSLPFASPSSKGANGFVAIS